MCLAQGHNTVTLVGIEPRTSRFGVRHSTTTPHPLPQRICDGILPYMGMIIYMNFHSPIPRMLNIKLGFDWPGDFREDPIIFEYVKDKFKPNLWYIISSLDKPWAQVS